MAKVTFIRKETDSAINNFPIVDGQLLASKQGSFYIDYGNQRIRYVSSVGSVNDVKVNGVSVVTNKTANINLSNYEQNTNKINTISSSSTNIQYPGAKAVYDYVNSVVGNIDSLLQDLDTGGGV